uniref:Uncharacterized protein n=1 Tax=Oryza punctata TaxID=4537 RepID=A0A0E0JTX6_ORYPU
MDKDEQVSYHFRQLFSLQDHPVDDDDDDDHWSEYSEPEDLTDQLVTLLKLLYEKEYFQNYEDSLEWYFDPERFECAGLDDYQRLVLCDNTGINTAQIIIPESDLAYIKFCEKLANETKWDKVNNIVYLQALKIAVMLNHIWSMRFDCYNYKDFDGVYFEVWKRVAKQKYDIYVACIDEMVHRTRAKILEVTAQHRGDNSEAKLSMDN